MSSCDIEAIACFIYAMICLLLLWFACVFVLVWNGQYGRVVSLCAPRDMQYRVAVIKVMEHHGDAIVCDTAQTACLAIEYFKTHKYPPQTFLPVDDLHNTVTDRILDRYDHWVFLPFEV